MMLTVCGMLSCRCRQPLLRAAHFSAHNACAAAPSGSSTELSSTSSMGWSVEHAASDYLHKVLAAPPFALLTSEHGMPNMQRH